MSQRELAALILRAAGLYAWIEAFKRMDWLVAWLFPDPGMGIPGPEVATVVGLLPLALAVVGTILLVRAPRFAGWMMVDSDGEPEDQRPPTTEGLFAAASAFVGVVLLVGTVPLWLELAARLAGLTEDYSPFQDMWGSRSIVLVIQVLLQLCIGIGLFVRGPAIYRLWRRIQRAVSRDVSA